MNNKKCASVMTLRYYEIPAIVFQEKMEKKPNILLHQHETYHFIFCFIWFLRKFVEKISDDTKM